MLILHNFNASHYIGDIVQQIQRGSKKELIITTIHQSMFPSMKLEDLVCYSVIFISTYSKWESKPCAMLLEKYVKGSNILYSSSVLVTESSLFLFSF